jgi:50S ribosomal subunit-associated GTPase HflX
VPGSLRSPQARLDEAPGLALAIDLEVIDTGIVSLSEIRPATFIGKGKVEEIAGLVKAHDRIGLVVDGPRAHAGAAAQPREGVEGEGASTGPA